jgi:tetrahydromethanopterin S-methyltransferase subunit C
LSLVTRAHTWWQVGQEPGRQVVSLGVALTLTAVALDVLLVGSLTLFFDLCFMALCLGLAALVRRQDFYLVALLPPVLMVLVFGFVAVVARDAIADPRDSFLQAVISGVVTHGVALFIGYALCLGWLGWRLHRKGDLASELERELGQPAG